MSRERVTKTSYFHLHLVLYGLSLSILTGQVVLGKDGQRTRTVIKVHDAPIFWQSKHQTVVSLVLRKLIILQRRIAESIYFDCRVYFGS